MASRPPLDPLHQPLPRTVVPRPALEARLDALGAGDLGVLVAPAGSGKSVLVRQWASKRPGLRIAALALDPQHDDPVVFARDFVASIRAAEPEGPGDGVAATASVARTVVDGLIEELAGVSGDLVLVVEDLHVLTNRPLLEDLGRLFCALPSSVRAVVTTRRDVPWALHSLRLDGALVSIRGTDLAFAHDEAGQLLENVSGRPLTAAQVDTLLGRTDGWAVGLQLAGISLREAEEVDAFVDTFAGSHRHVAEYLLEEVLEGQEPDARGFLLRTSVLDWLSVDLCDAVTGAGDARTMLKRLESRSLFLIPLDPSGQQYRYHRLFGDLLRYRLQVESPGEVPDLHRRAAHWLVQHGRSEEAVSHLLEAGDHEGAFDVISSVGHRVYERGESATLVGWLTAVEAGQPDVPARVQVSLLAAQVGYDEVGVAADTYRRLTRRTDLTLGERTAANALYAMLGFRDLPPDAVQRAADEVREAVTQLGPGEVVDFLGVGGRDSALTMAEYAAAGSRFLSGDVTGASAALEKVLALPGVGYPVWKVYVLGLLALTRAWLGHGAEAFRLTGIATQTAEVAGISDHPACAHAHLAVALAHLDRGELGPAQERLDRSRPLLARRQASVTYFDLQRALEVIVFAVSQGPDLARAALAVPTGTGPEAVVLRRAKHALQARLLMGTNHLAEARTLLGPDRGEAHLAAPRIELALLTGDRVQARAVLDRWLPDEDDLRGQVRHRLATFAVLKAEGRREQAHQRLREAVAMAHDDRLLWPFLEVPAALQVLRREGDRQTAFTDDAVWELTTRLHPRLAAQSALVEHLTERELEVLAYLPGRMKNPEIAADMYVSVNTLKTHVRSIYTKLGATERNEAVARAVELGLL